MSATEAADLARIILTDSEDEHPDALYLLNVREARALALAVARVAELADRLDAEAELVGEYGGTITIYATAIRTALNGETA